MCLAPHGLRRTCARLCQQAGGQLEQIQFLPGHVSIETKEQYLGCKQRFQNAVYDGIDLDPGISGDEAIITVLPTSEDLRLVISE